ncbi:MAG: glycosyltransferase family 4 protein [Anaerolineae bacterium]|nr:glycosyltransferase family 4 protein [Anaerolineae bacterium]
MNAVTSSPNRALPSRNLLMIGSDPSVAQGQKSTHYHMLRHFSAHWRRIDYICPPGRGAIPRQVHSNVFVHPSPWPKIMQPRFIQRKGAELLAQRDYDLVTTQDFGFFYTGMAAWRLLRGRDIPLVSEIHHVEGYPRTATRKEQVYRWLAKRYIPFINRRAAAFRTVNRIEVPELLRQLGVPDEKILVLPSIYLDYDVFHPPAADDTTPGQYDLLYVGRLVPNKGLFTLLEGFYRLRQTRPDATLALRGDGPLRPALRTRINEMGLTGSVTWIPRLEQVEALANLYRSARVLVCASTAEGGPRVTVEAMACATPVITTPVGVMRELVEDGVNGLVFHWDPAELAAQAARLLADETLAARLGEAGRASVQGFRAEDVIGRYAEGYHDLLDRLDR